LESAGNRRWTATGASATAVPAGNEADKQFSLTRAVSLNRQDAKNNFSPVTDKRRTCVIYPF
jgi:hypothetical protein